MNNLSIGISHEAADWPTSHDFRIFRFSCTLRRIMLNNFLARKIPFDFALGVIPPLSGNIFGLVALLAKSNRHEALHWPRQRHFTSTVAVQLFISASLQLRARCELFCQNIRRFRRAKSMTFSLFLPLASSKLQRRMMRERIRKASRPLESSFSPFVRK